MTIAGRNDVSNYSSIYEQLLTKLSLTKGYNELYDAIYDEDEFENSDCFRSLRQATARPNERYSQSFAKDEVLSIKQGQDVHPEMYRTRDDKMAMTIDASIESIFDKRSKSNSDAGYGIVNAA